MTKTYTLSLRSDLSAEALAKAEATKQSLEERLPRGVYAEQSEVLAMTLEFVILVL